MKTLYCYCLESQKLIQFKVKGSDEYLTRLYNIHLRDNVNIPTYCLVHYSATKKLALLSALDDLSKSLDKITKKYTMDIDQLNQKKVNINKLLAAKTKTQTKRSP